MGTMEETAYGQQEIADKMQTSWAGKKIKFYESIDSTNIAAKQEAEKGAPSGTLIVADMQTAGRGRRGRSWSSPAGTNIYYTLILRPDFAQDKASMLTLLMALSVVKGLKKTLQADETDTTDQEEEAIQPDEAFVEKATRLDRVFAVEGGDKILSADKKEIVQIDKAFAAISIKWPNDVVANGKKICGILTEMGIESDGGWYVVIGVGINVGRQDFAPELADKATSLEAEFGRKFSRSLLLAHIMEAFEKDYDLFCRQGSLAGLKERYEQLLVNKDREVTVLDPKGEYQGIARGINEEGELLVELPDGKIAQVCAGEVSVRGIYGYV
ncbi:MAG: biotin--[acetyl-CoA-carboxylase] ligase [Bacteroidales bacterium]|nr:biotin--[acetyl-CoA-carboxylase] ligase [Lachnoclostridium sp.]MCM1383407.1 biotin--[acetyl-CoA-carboxylase] ligase [Lachnoclostridium sp.]MCM1464255.1 biotin--[acetyl-CoA-carboxylase] ligase [Bacteroidales bacterium]